MAVSLRDKLSALTCFPTCSKSEALIAISLLLELPLLFYTVVLHIMPITSHYYLQLLSLITVYNCVAIIISLLPSSSTVFAVSLRKHLSDVAMFSFITLLRNFSRASLLCRYT